MTARRALRSIGSARIGSDLNMVPWHVARNYLIERPPGWLPNVVARKPDRVALGAKAECPVALIAHPVSGWVVLAACDARDRTTRSWWWAVGGCWCMTSRMVHRPERPAHGLPMRPELPRFHGGF
jgi:hypothetical protein